MSELNPRIYLLALGTFTVGTEGYVIAGVLPAVAHDTHTSVAVCGQMVTVFALAYALGGPPLIRLFHEVPPKRVLIGAAVFFAAANLLAALSPDIAVLITARILAAGGAALFLAPAAAAAAALTPPELLPRALSVTATGNALALTAGAPIGTLIGSAFGWRGSFLFVTGLAILSALMVGAFLPEVPAAPTPAGGRLALLGHRPIQSALATTFGLFLASYTVYTYLSPVMGTAIGAGSTGVAILMVVFGAGGLIGGRMIGRVLARFPLGAVLRAVLLVVTIMISLLALLTGVHAHTTADTVIAYPIVLIFGAAWWSGGISQQTRLATLAPDQRSLALGLQFSTQFLGVATAGAVGGLTLGLSGPVAVPTVAGIIAIATIVTIQHTPSLTLTKEPEGQDHAPHSRPAAR
ncbi:MFS transporter [Actinoallomurus rhizosphaericola]|uniref:MFS transporter n=1 Tax=Actinoallomurus rhizosphaericola TaxID=2952536 RepID=UPI002092631E|nr:MFS transporter [Actinoallomurus rhizosphaericola]MCO6000095.1 MFS transporter [Actinoallomurus rhizosphaericola]